MVTAVSSATAAPANSYAVQTARREAQQAEQTAQNLQVQAEAAQRSADQEQARADDLNSQSADAGQRSVSARRNLAAANDSAARPSTAAQAVAPAPPPDNARLINASGRVAGGVSAGMFVNVYAREAEQTGVTRLRPAL